MMQEEVSFQMFDLLFFCAVQVVGKTGSKNLVEMSVEELLNQSTCAVELDNLPLK